MTINGTSASSTRIIAVAACALTLASCDAPVAFDADTWRNGETLVVDPNDAPRLRMADGLVRDKALIGNSKSQIEAMLGPPTQTAKFADYGLRLSGIERRHV